VSRVLVTGAAGFVGANLVRRLVADGHRVVAVTRPGTETWRLKGVSDDLELAEVDLRDRDSVARFVAAAAPEWIFHLAAHGAYSSQRDVARILETNLIGTANLLDACLERGFDAFVHSGSSSEYGLKDHAPAESEAIAPNSAYAVGKAAAAMYCRYRAVESGSHVVTLRLYSVFGPWEAPGRLIPALVIRGLAGELPPLVDPKIARDFVYVDDVVDAFLSAAETAGENRGPIYNVGSGRQTSIEEAVEATRSLLEIEARPDWGSMPDRSWDTTTWVADASLIERELGWQPRHDFRTGLSSTIEWMREPDLRRFYKERMG
jgi:UDP-glucose 4-epimerase